MRRRLCLSALFMLCRLEALSAQTSPDSTAAITAVVRRYIDAMEARDTAYVRAASLPTFTQVAVLHPGTATDVPRVRTLDEVIAGLATRTSRWVGRVWSPTVSQHGGVAVFTAPYDAWTDGRLSNCGMDYYVLAQSGGRWLISQVIYTLQREGCPPSPLGPPG